MNLQKMKTARKEPVSAGYILKSHARGDGVSNDLAPGNFAAEDPAPGNFAAEDPAPGNLAAEDPASEGCFIGIGVGPGDPEFLTIKAIRCIRECDYLALPVRTVGISLPAVLPSAADENGSEAAGGGEEAEKSENGTAGTAQQYKKALESCVSYQIVNKAFALLEDDTLQNKRKILLGAPMCRDQALLQKTHDQNAAFLLSVLKKGKTIAYITLGDPGIYSTCMYLFARLRENGYKTLLVPGVPSFCAAAAKAGISLAEDREEIHIFPAPSVREEELNLPGTKILMKAGRQMSRVKQELLQTKTEAVMVENCGMENERICLSAEEIPDSAGYYAIVIAK